MDLEDKIKLEQRMENALEKSAFPEFKFALREDLKDRKEFLPTRVEDGSSGWDVFSAPLDHKDIVLQPGDYALIELGFRALCPDGWYYQLHPRSSTFAKKKCQSLIGIVDLSWEGFTKMAVKYCPPDNVKDPLVIKFGEAIGQIIPTRKETMNVVEVSNDELDALFKARDGKRKDGGFGSSDQGFIKYG